MIILIKAILLIIKIIDRLANLSIYFVTILRTHHHPHFLLYLNSSIYFNDHLIFIEFILRFIADQNFYAHNYYCFDPILNSTYLRYNHSYFNLDLTMFSVLRFNNLYLNYLISNFD